MQIKNFKYMKSAEFKARQKWLEFVDAIGIALKIMEEVKSNAADWFKNWTKEFRTPHKINKPKQLNLQFARSLKDWANWKHDKNLMLFS